MAPPDPTISRDTLVRLEDPSGEAAAWIAPEHGANCVAYAVRHAGTWVQLLHSPDPAALDSFPTRFGCPILFPFPGYVTDSVYVWRGVTRVLPANLPGTAQFAHGFAHDRPWRIESVSPAKFEAEMNTARDLGALERSAYPFDVRLRVTVELRDRALVMRLEATNDGRDDAPVGLGLHPYFDAAALGERSTVHVRLPSGSVRTLSAGPAASEGTELGPDVQMPSTGRAFLGTASGLGDETVVSIAGPRADRSVRLSFLQGFRHLVIYAPADRPSVALEPLTSAHSAASRPEGDPSGLAALRSGASLRAAVIIRLEAPE